MNKFVNCVLGFVLVVLSIMVCWLSIDLQRTTEELIQSYDVEPELIIMDSVKFDTMYITTTEVVKLPIYNTDTILINDTILVTDSADVVIPISTYHYDTTLNQTHISLICEGYDVRLNSLLIENFLSVPTQEKQAKRWSIGVGIGMTYCDGFKILPTIGLSYNIFKF